MNKKHLVEYAIKEFAENKDFRQFLEMYSNALVNYYDNEKM